MTIVTLHSKTKTKRDKKLFFAGIFNQVASSIPLKFESPILISKSVMGDLYKEKV